MLFVVRTLSIFSLSFFVLFARASPFPTEEETNAWFKQYAHSLTDSQTYRLLQQFPKGGDLHHHLSGSAYGKWWYELATNQILNGGYRYFTKIDNGECVSAPSFHTISNATYSTLTKCEQKQYKALGELSQDQKRAFIHSVELDKPEEGRDEFFGFHWQRLNELTQNPYIIAQVLLKNMQLYQLENMRYLETQLNIRFMKRADGSNFPADEALQIVTDMLESEAAKETGITVRFQYALVRFTDNIEEQLDWIFKFVDANRKWYVGVNLVGREDDPRGHPLRFLSSITKLRAQYPAIRLSFHAGESEHADTNIRDTLLLGAERIGHGINLLKDPSTYLLMRHNRYLIETNLISNLKLEYIEDLSTHPFPQLLRTGVPTALSTDDRGMWNATLTDEYYLAFTQFNLSWSELVTLSQNSIKYGFLQDEKKEQLLAQLNKDLTQFLTTLLREANQTAPDSSEPLSLNSNMKLYSGFICEFAPTVCQQ